MPEEPGKPARARARRDSSARAGGPGSRPGKAGPRPSGASGRAPGGATDGSSAGAAKRRAGVTRSSGAGGRAGAPPPDSGDAGRGRPALTSRAAILALVICVIALSLAYPLREYIAQRSEIAELRAENSRTQREVEELEKRSKELRDPAYLEREARTRLHYQYPGERSYVVVSRDDKKKDGDGSSGSSDPWFTRLLDSVKGADDSPAHQERIPEAKPPKD